MSADAFEPIAEQLLTVFSHIFERVPLHPSMLHQTERIRTASSSKVGAVILATAMPLSCHAGDSHALE